MPLPTSTAVVGGTERRTTAICAFNQRIGAGSSARQAVGSGAKGWTVTQQVPWALPSEVSWHSGEGGTLFRSLTILYWVGP